ncbi:MAG: response regulator, partial [Pseudomonadota bacterium]
KISVIGGEKVGATFILTFPPGKLGHTSPHNSEEVAEAINIKLKGKALVVDDEENILDILENQLKSFGLEVTTAHDGLEALNKLKSETYDFVLTDITMPHMDGITLIQESQKLSHLKNTKYLTISEILSEASDQYKNLHTDGHIQKPFSKETLRKALADLSSKK